MKDYYEILKVDPRASPSEIKKAYRELAKIYHPDISAIKDAELRFKEVSLAYGVLSCPDRRNQFDAERLAGSLSESQGSTKIPIISKACKDCYTLGYVYLNCNQCQSKGFWNEKKPYGKTKVDSKIICTICRGNGKIKSICYGCLGTGKIKKIKI